MLAMFLQQGHMPMPDCCCCAWVWGAAGHSDICFDAAGAHSGQMAREKAPKARLHAASLFHGLALADRPSHSIQAAFAIAQAAGGWTVLLTSSDE